jgi:hypothetical protein
MKAIGRAEVLCIGAVEEPAIPTVQSSIAHPSR